MKGEEKLEEKKKPTLADTALMQRRPQFLSF